MDTEKQIMPVLQADKYLVPADSRSITPDQKKSFLEAYYQSGNQSVAKKMAGIGNLNYALSTDKAFLEDFAAVKDAMKHNLEQTMYQNGLKEKGYMDRITWLRKNFPKEYNPNYVDKDNNPAEAIKELSSKLDQYTMIPKQSIINVEGDSDASETNTQI